MPNSNASATDSVLVAKLQQGDRLAFEELYERYKNGVYTYCVRLLADSAAAEDVTQDSFIKLFEGIRSIRQPELFRAWLFRIARNEAFLRIRKTRKNGQINEESVWETETPHERFVTRETSEIVRRLLEELKQEYREILVLREYEQMSYAEIAIITGTTKGSVKSRIFKARKAMTARLKPFFQ